ncbi:hypothetical protein ABPG75_005636 [Micractinium tetrahymenae]
MLCCSAGWRLRLSASALFQLCLVAAFMRTAPQLALALVLPLTLQLATEAAAACQQEGQQEGPPGQHSTARPAGRTTFHLGPPRPAAEGRDDWLPGFLAAGIATALAWEWIAIASAHG